MRLGSGQRRWFVDPSIRSTKEFAARSARDVEIVGQARRLLVAWPTKRLSSNLATMFNLD